jgi:hypothetical protein
LRGITVPRSKVPVGVAASPRLGVRLVPCCPGGGGGGSFAGMASVGGGVGDHSRPGGLSTTRVGTASERPSGAAAHRSLPERLARTRPRRSARVRGSLAHGRSDRQPGSTLRARPETQPPEGDSTAQTLHDASPATQPGAIAGTSPQSPPSTSTSWDASWSTVVRPSSPPPSFVRPCAPRNRRAHDETIAHDARDPRPPTPRTTVPL